MTFFGSKRKSQATPQIQEQIPHKQTLKDFVPDEKLYTALQTFLMGYSSGRLPMLGTVDSLLLKADLEKANGERFKARLDYETAARIEIYRLDKGETERFLALSRDMTENCESNRVVIETMLANVDEVLRISKLYYSSIAPHAKVVAH